MQDQWLGDRRTRHWPWRAHRGRLQLHDGLGMDDAERPAQRARDGGETAAIAPGDCPSVFVATHYIGHARVHQMSTWCSSQSAAWAPTRSTGRSDSDVVSLYNEAMRANRLTGGAMQEMVETFHERFFEARGMDKQRLYRDQIAVGAAKDEQLGGVPEDYMDRGRDEDTRRDEEARKAHAQLRTCGQGRRRVVPRPLQSCC